MEELKKQIQELKQEDFLNLLLWCFNERDRRAFVDAEFLADYLVTNEVENEKIQSEDEELETFVNWPEDSLEEHSSNLTSDEEEVQNGR